MNRPAVAILSNSCPPYRLHLHRRIVREMPQIKLHSVFTHEQTDVAQSFRAGEDIGAVSFGQGESMLRQRPLHEYAKGGRIIDWMRRTDVRAILVSGYNDPGRLRIIRWCHRNDVPCLLVADSNIRNTVATGFKGWLKTRLLRQVVRWCDGMMVCGRLGREYFLQYGAPPERIYDFPYEPDYEMIQNLEPQYLEQIRQRFGLSPDRRRIVYSGRLISVKRVDLLIDAFAQVASRRPQWDLLIVGDGPLRNELEARVPESVRSRVQWAGYLDDQPAISALYRLSDVLVLPSDHEPWAVVINEAAAAGMALIASHVVGAAAELVRDDVNGRIFQAGDLSQLTSALEHVTGDADLPRMKAASTDVLNDWRRRGDPVAGLARALADNNVISRD